MSQHREINFTKATLGGLPTPSDGKSKYHDSKEEGLSLYVTSTGHKSFYIKKCVNHRQKEIITGRFPDMSVEQARKAARRIKGQIAEWKNPCEKEEMQAKEQTFGEAFEVFMERHAKVNTKTWQETKRIVESMASHLFRCPLSSITKLDIHGLHGQIGRERGKYQANRVLDWIRAIYNKAISWGWEGTNPAIGVEKFKERKRDRFVQHDEFPRLMEALANEDNPDMRDFFLLCLYTGARKSNILSMKWEDIDFSINE
jgi:integrase